MFEAKLTEGIILKKIVESIKDLVTDVNIDVSPQGKNHPCHWNKAITCIYRYFPTSYGQLSCRPCVPKLIPRRV